METKYPTALLADVSENFDRLRIPLSSRERALRQGPYPYYGATGIMDYIDDFIFEGDYLLVAEDGSVETDSGWPVTQIVQGRFWVNNHAHILCASSFKETRFLFYALSNTPIRPYLTGSVQSKLSQTNLNRIEIPYPDKETRHAIVAILAALDDKIELNHRMNHTLEAMAQALFKSWFMDFEPFRDQDMEDSPLGPMPRGWRVAKLNDIAALSREGINPSSYPDELFDHHSIPAFDEGRMPRVENGEQIKSNKFKMPSNAILISKLNPRFPRVWFPTISNTRRSVCSTEFLVALPKENATCEYLYSLFCSHSFREVFSTFVTGTSTSHQRVRPEDFLLIDLVVSPKDVVTQFSEVSSPLYEKMAQNLYENSTLAAIRDTLLPKLLSGEMRVKDAEKFVEVKL